MNPLKLLLVVFSCTCLPNPAYCGELLPTWKFENHPASDGSETQCLVIQPSAGIVYEIESSEALTTWETEAKFYSFGETVAFPMRRLVPLPPPDPEAPPVSTPPPPVSVALMLSTCSSDGGGTVLSWPSLEIEGAPPLVVRIATGMHAAWNDLPICVQHFGGHEFTLFRTGIPLPAPAENSTTSGKDAAMLAAFQENFAAMNQAVADHVATAKHRIKPAPTVTAPARFFRIRAHRIDTDGDGTSDDLEFTNISHAPAVDGLVSNPFDGDSNKDGIPDGNQLDSDNDGTVDSKDLAPGNSNDAAEIIEIPRYAFFEIGGKAIQLSNLGTVLFEHSTWQGGHAASIGSGVNALAINDNDWIVGEKNTVIIQSPLWTGSLLYVQTPGSPMAPVSGANGVAASVYSKYDNFPGMLSNSGVCAGYVIQTTAPFAAFEDYDHRQSWQLKAGGSNSTPLADKPFFARDNNLGWSPWRSTQGKVFHNGNELPILDFEPYNVIRDGKQDTTIHAMSASGGAFTSRGGGAWIENEKYKGAFDIADDGTAIGSNEIITPGSSFSIKLPIQVNGKWLGLNRTAPGINNEWTDDTAALMDITPKGWILATRGAAKLDAEGHEDFSYPNYFAGVMLPIQVKATHEILPKATGVDDFSISSDIPDDAVKDRIWIMAPSIGRSTEITLNAPLNSKTPLEISATGVRFNGSIGGATLIAPSSTFNVDSAGPSGTDLPVTLAMGSSQSISSPIGVKIMKRRTIKVTVHKVTRQTPGLPDKSPDIPLDLSELQTYLDNVFESQINAGFSIHQGAELKLDWDKDRDGGLDVGTLGLGNEQRLIYDAGATSGDTTNPSIRIFVMGMEGMIAGDAQGYTERAIEGGIPAIWIRGDFNFLYGIVGLLKSIPHEVGHVLIDDGHPDQGGGPSPLVGTDVKQRLMSSGLFFFDRSFRLVKGEWDSAENWLHARPSGDN